ncbi:MAG: hypothetical protein ABSC94_12990 [Polyangiaceae bacterium]|jgi:hypothetical protein
MSQDGNNVPTTPAARADLVDSSGEASDRGREQPLQTGADVGDILEASGIALLKTAGTAALFLAAGAMGLAQVPLARWPGLLASRAAAVFTYVTLAVEQRSRRLAELADHDDTTERPPNFQDDPVAPGTREGSSHSGRSAGDVELLLDRKGDPVGTPPGESGTLPTEVEPSDLGHALRPRATRPARAPFDPESSHERQQPVGAPASEGRKAPWLVAVDPARFKAAGVRPLKGTVPSPDGTIATERAPAADETPPPTPSRLSLVLARARRRVEESAPAASMAGAAVVGAALLCGVAETALGAAAGCAVYRLLSKTRRSRGDDLDEAVISSTSR